MKTERECWCCQEANEISDELFEGNRWVSMFTFFAAIGACAKKSALFRRQKTQ